MISLTEICGVTLWLDEETGEIHLGDELEYEDEVDIDIEDIVPALLNKFVKYPEKVYRHYKQVSLEDDIRIFDDSDVSYDLLNLPNGLLGIEYLRSHIYYSEAKKNKYACVVEVVMGEITVLIQKNSDNNEPFSMTKLVDEIQLIYLTESDKLAIPSGVYYTFINTGTQKAMVAIVVNKDTEEVDYEVLEENRGLAYYVISKNAKVEVVPNPKYECSSSPERMHIGECDDEVQKKFMHKLIESGEMPLYQLAKKNLNVFEEVIA